MSRRAMYSLWLAQTELMLGWLEGLREVLENPGRPVPEILGNVTAVPPAGAAR